MRRFEAGHERVAAPEHFVAVRLDGRGFGKLLRGRHELDRPLDVRVRDILIATADYLMNGSAPVVFGYTHSDEITLLLRREPTRIAATIATLVGEASAKCTLLLGALVSFSAEVAELPDVDGVVDYFEWRQDAAARAAVQAHGAWGLQQRGTGEAAARAQVAAADEAGLVALLGALAIDVGGLPLWQTRGVGLVWDRPLPGVTTLHRRVRVLLELGSGDEHRALLRAQAERAATPEACAAPA